MNNQDLRNKVITLVCDNPFRALALAAIAGGSVVLIIGVIV